MYQPRQQFPTPIYANNFQLNPPKPQVISPKVSSITKVPNPTTPPPFSLNSTPYTPLIFPKNNTHIPKSSPLPDKTDESFSSPIKTDNSESIEKANFKEEIQCDIISTIQEEIESLPKDETKLVNYQKNLEILTDLHMSKNDVSYSSIGNSIEGYGLPKPSIAPHNIDKSRITSPLPHDTLGKRELLSNLSIVDPESPVISPSAHIVRKSLSKFTEKSLEKIELQTTRNRLKFLTERNEIDLQKARDYVSNLEKLCDSLSMGNNDLKKHINMLTCYQGKLADYHLVHKDKQQVTSRIDEAIRSFYINNPGVSISILKKFIDRDIYIIEGKQYNLFLRGNSVHVRTGGGYLPLEKFLLNWKSLKVHAQTREKTRKTSN